MIRHAHQLISEADAVVHYNGSKFDMPVLNMEFLELDLEPPHKFAEIDLLKTVRKRFKFPSNKLDYVAQRLGFGAKVKHRGMDLWRDCMDGDEASWKTMERYNKKDVVLLQKVYRYVLPWIDNHPNHGLYQDASRPTCKNCGSQNVKLNGIERTKTGTYQRFRCVDCLAPMRGRQRAQKTQQGVMA